MKGIERKTELRMKKMTVFYGRIKQLVVILFFSKCHCGDCRVEMRGIECLAFLSIAATRLVWADTCRTEWGCSFLFVGDGRTMAAKTEISELTRNSSDC